jgi:membrane protein DedA with SNARE-associated domain
MIVVNYVIGKLLLCNILLQAWKNSSQIEKTKAFML